MKNQIALEQAISDKINKSLWPDINACPGRNGITIVNNQDPLSEMQIKFKNGEPYELVETRGDDKAMLKKLSQLDFLQIDL